MAKKWVLVFSLMLVLGLATEAQAVVRYLSIHPTAFKPDPSYGISIVSETVINGEGAAWAPVFLPDNATILSVSVFGDRHGDAATGNVRVSLYRVNIATRVKETLFSASLPLTGSGYQSGEDTTLNSGSAIVDNNNYWYYVRASYGQAAPGGAYFYGAKIKYQTLF